MKRLLCLLLVLTMVVPFGFALADTQPKPIDKLSEDEIPETVDGQHHYLMLCVDQWEGKTGNLGNTDGIVLVTIDTRAHRVMMTSFIRDALVERPDGVIGRINYIAKNWGPEALCNIISTHIGVKVEKYIMFDFNKIASIIDYLGGVDITVDSSEASYLKRYPLTKTQTEPAMAGAGTYHFCGRAAVIYMRIRKASGHGDFQRTARVRSVLSLLADKCRNISFDDAKALVDDVLDNTLLTNMNLDEMTEAMSYCYDLRGATIEELRIPADEDVTPITYAGMAVQEIDWAASREKMADFLQNSFLVMDDEDDE